MNNTTRAEARPPRLLRLPAVLDRVGLQKTVIYDRIKAGRFPKQIKIDGAVVWLESDINDWIAEVVAEQREVEMHARSEQTSNVEFAQRNKP